MVDISFVITVYENNPLLIKKSIESILDVSNLFNIEIIVVDDGSKNDYCELSNIFLKTKYYKKANGGVSSARNFGIKKANGKYITFIDCGDNVDFDAYRKLSIINNADLYSFNMQIRTNNKKSKWISIDNKCGVIDKKTVIEKLTTVDNFNSVCSKLFKVSIIKDYDIFFDESSFQGEDFLFVADFVNKSKNIYAYKETSYIYYKIEKSRIDRVRNKTHMFLDDIIKVNKKRLQLIEDYDLNMLYKDKANQKEIESLYNCVSELLYFKCFDNKLASKISIIVDGIKEYPHSLKTKLKYKLLKNKCFKTMLILSYLRMCYLYVVERI